VHRANGVARGPARGERTERALGTSTPLSVAITSATPAPVAAGATTTTSADARNASDAPLSAMESHAGMSVPAKSTPAASASASASDSPRRRQVVMASTAVSIENATAPTTTPMTTVMVNLATRAVCRPVWRNLRAVRGGVRVGGWEGGREGGVVVGHQRPGGERNESEKKSLDPRSRATKTQTRTTSRMPRLAGDGTARAHRSLSMTS
jgi:hypothetical protein